ncbi:MAG: thioredoxin family protein [Kofleriaceae bacterium]
MRWRGLAPLVAMVVLMVACSGTPRPAPAKSVQLNAPGAIVAVADHLEPGYVTVVDFWAESCGACHTVGALVAEQVATEPRVLIRKIDVGDGFTPVAETYGVNVLPHYRIYDKHGKQRHVLVGNECLKAAALARQLVSEP